VHEERQVQRLVLAEDVDHRRARVRHQQHVRFMDLLEPADRRAVEHQPVLEHPAVERLDRHGEVLHGAGQVAEPDVDELDPLVGYVPQDLITAAEHQLSLAASASLARIVCRPVPRARL
jgi:hypothetical protein